MNGLRPPLTAPPGFAVRQSRSDSKECCRPALLFREGEFPWQTRKPIKNISSAGTTPLARLLSAVPDSVRPCRNYVELHIILLYFPAFCDTILILINFTAENSRWNINIFAKVFPAKSPQIHPTISEFAELRYSLPFQSLISPLNSRGNDYCHSPFNQGARHLLLFARKTSIKIRTLQPVQSSYDKQITILE